MKLFLMPNRPTWWVWLLCASALAFGLAGYEAGYFAALLLALAQAGVFVICDGAWTFPVQIRVAYTLILLGGQIPGLRWLNWVPMAGTFGLVIFGYCPLARMLALCPWNRTEPLTLDLMRRTFLTRPRQGNLLHGLPVQSCDLEARAAFSQSTIQH